MDNWSQWSLCPYVSEMCGSDHRVLGLAVGQEASTGP